MLYVLTTSSDFNNTLSIPIDFLKQHNNLMEKDRIIVQAGERKVRVKVIISSDLPINNLIISEDVLNYLSIPKNLRYQIISTKDGIKIGPIIGLLLKVLNKNLTEEELTKAISYSLIYPKCHGLLYIFTEECIDPKKGLVEGFYFSPDRDNKKITWKKAMLPYADAIYRRVGISSEKRELLINKSGNHMFNSYYFDKLEFWKFASRCAETKEYIPSTRLLKSVEDIDDMLREYKILYLKLKNGSLAHGLIKVWKEDNKYYFKKKLSKFPIIFEDRDEVELFIEDILNKNNYLVQRGIECLEHNKRQMDFRVIMQKDDTLNWKCTLIAGTLGAKNGICSNYQNYGYMLSFEDVFSRLLKYDEKFIFKKRLEVINVCRKVCELLDLTGENYGDLGIDVAIDRNLRIWILEINKKHYHTVALEINDLQSYYAIKSNIIKYALALSGFSSNNFKL